MNVKDAIVKRRTVRKFMQKAVEEEKLIKLIDYARLAAYPANVQPLKFRIITDGDELKRIYPATKWAGYLKDGAPKPDERPMAYIAVLGDTSIKQGEDFLVESGAAITTIMLAATEMGLSSCWLGAIDRRMIKEELNLSDNLYVSYLLAIGYGAQESKTYTIKDNDVKYYEDENGKIHVPKRSLDEIIIK